MVIGDPRLGRWFSVLSSALVEARADIYVGNPARIVKLEFAGGIAIFP
jgi:hypothetical protein